MESQSIDQLKGVIQRRDGFARTNRFRIFMMPPESLFDDTETLRDLNILCDSCNLPGRQIQTFETNYTRQAIKVAQSFINEDVSFTFNLTNDYFIKRMFDGWTNMIINRETFKKSYDSEYKRDVEIFQMNNQGDDVYGIKLRNAFPTSVQSIELSNTEGELSQITVEFTYENFEEIRGAIPKKTNAANIGGKATFGAGMFGGEGNFTDPNEKALAWWENNYGKK